MKIVLTRHSKTQGNIEKRYVGGSTDEPLCREGIAILANKVPNSDIERVYTSGLIRTSQTAAFLYPNAELIAVPELREMEFGEFEGKNYLELGDSKAFDEWLNSNCETRCPGGEDRQEFLTRVLKAFRALVEKEEREGTEELHFVVHGGTIMAVVSELCDPAPGYFEVITCPAQTWECVWDGTVLEVMAIDDPNRMTAC